MPTYRVTSPDGRVFNVTASEGATQDEIIARAQSTAPASAAPSAPTPPKAAAPPAGDIPVLGQAVRDVNQRQSFGWATPLMTAIVPETYPELAAMLGLTLLGGPLAGAAGKTAMKYGAGPATKYGSEALARVASAALPAAATGLATGQGVTPGVGAGAGQAAIEAAIPALRATPGISHALARRAANVDVTKLSKELGRMFPQWAPLFRGKKDIQGLYDVMVSPQGEQALWSTYRGALDKVFGSGKSIDSPALYAYFDLTKRTPGAARFREAAPALGQARKVGTASIPVDTARQLFEELEKDAIQASKRLASDPRAYDMIRLANAARQEIGRSVPGVGEEMLSAWEQRGLGGKVLEFFEQAKALGPGVFGPRYDAVKAQQYLGSKGGAETLTGLENVAQIVNRGRPGVAEGWSGGRASTGIPLGRVNVPLPLSARSPGYTPGGTGRAIESFAQPSFQRAAEMLAE